MMGFFGQKIMHVGEMPVGVAELGQVEVISQSSTINQVSQIHWSWGLAGGKTESSSCGKLT